jgi:TolB-like protein
MADTRQRLDKFFAELRRRKVIRVVIVYGIVGFAVIQAADVIGPALSLPPDFVTFIVAVTFLGYPIAIVLAWSYDIVPDSTVQPTDAAAHSDQATNGTSGSGISVFRVMVAVGAATIIGLSWLQFRPSVQAIATNAAVAYVDSVAVMPLDNLTGDPGYEYLGVGITEEIITHLAQIAPLKVISRHSVEAISGQNLTVPQLSTALGVRHVIEGSIRLDGDSLRVTLQHINGETDAHIWAESFRGKLDDLIELQEDVARQATSRVVMMIPGIKQPVLRPHVELGPGQKVYLDGKHWLGRRTPEGLRKAIEKFSEALELDDQYAPVYADLASAYALALFYRYDVGIDAYTLAARSLAMSETAIQLDANLAAGYAARGYLGALIGQPAVDVAADFDRAAKLQPNAASIPSWRARLLAEQGEIEAAFSEAGRAVELDPLAPGRRIALAELSLHLGRYDIAIEESKVATALEPSLARSRAIEARALLLSGRAERCASLSLGPHRVLRATCLEAAGRQVEARAIIEKVLAEVRNDSLKERGFSPVITYEDLAVDYAWRGDAKKAMEWAALSYGLSPVGMEIRVLESALFDDVRSDPEFELTIKAIRSELYNRVRRDSQEYL